MFNKRILEIRTDLKMMEWLKEMGIQNQVIVKNEIIFSFPYIKFDKL